MVNSLGKALKLYLELNQKYQGGNKTMSKPGKNIYKRKDGRWEGRYIKSRDIDGKIIYGSIYGKNRAEVKEKLNTFFVEEADSMSDAADFDKQLTFTDVVNQWLSIISLRIKPSTHARYTAMINRHILPAIGDYKMQTIQAVDISHFAKEKLENGRTDGTGGLSTKTVRDMLYIIKTVIGFACDEDIISNRFTIAYPKLHQQEMRVLSRKEQSSLEAVLTSNLNIYKLGILLCLYTGLRIGEVCALQWRDISADFDMLSVRHTIQRIKNAAGENRKTKIILDTPKSLRSTREIPIPKFISAYLRDYVRDSYAYFLSTEDMIFTEPRTLQNHFIRNVKAANIVNAKYHCLRHTFATRCIEAGVDIKSLSEMLGHSSVSITLNRYVHSSFEQKRESMNKLERYIGI